MILKISHVQQLAVPVAHVNLHHSLNAETKAVALPIPVRMHDNLHTIPMKAWLSAIMPAQWDAQHEEQTYAEFASAETNCKSSPASSW